MDIENVTKASKLINYIINLAEDYFLIEAGTKSAILNISKEDKEILYNSLDNIKPVEDNLYKHDKLNTVFGELFIVESLPKNRKPIITPKR